MSEQADRQAGPFKCTDCGEFYDNEWTPHSCPACAEQADMNHWTKQASKECDEAIARLRAEVYEECAMLHEQVEIVADGDMRAIIEYRDLIRQMAKRHAPLKFPADRSALIRAAIEADEQADRREADSREVQAPATEGGIVPLDKPVTGSASQSAYHRKLGSYSAAQANNDCHMDEKQYRSVEQAVAAVLASEGVVDPETYDKALKQWQDQAYNAEQEIEQLKADLALRDPEGVIELFRAAEKERDLLQMQVSIVRDFISLSTGDRRRLLNELRAVMDKECSKGAITIRADKERGDE